MGATQSVTELKSFGQTKPGTLRGKLIRCLVQKAEPILYPAVSPERWNDGFVTALRIERHTLVLCVSDRPGKFQVLHEQSVWDTDPRHFVLCQSPEEWESAILEDVTTRPWNTVDPESVTG